MHAPFVPRMDTIPCCVSMSFRVTFSNSCGEHPISARIVNGVAKRYEALAMIVVTLSLVGMSGAFSSTL